MKRSIPQIMTTVLVLMFISSSSIAIRACEDPSPMITLSPNVGFVTMISGSGFGSQKYITIKWDGTPIPTYPASVKTDSNGVFTCMIVAYEQPPEGGTFTITATDGPNSASALFTVPLTLGQTGQQGPKGSQGETGPAGAEGKDGINGTQGLQGNTGATEEGPIGPAGEIPWLLIYTMLGLSATSFIVAYSAYSKRRYEI